MIIITNLIDMDSVDWSINVVSLPTGQSVMTHSADIALKTASVPKLFLLHEVAEQLDSGKLKEGDLVDRRNTLQVSDAGIWQHLLVDELPLNDVAMFVAAFSDNLATNTLIDLIGLDRLKEKSVARGYRKTMLNDYIRKERIPEVHPSTVSQGSSRELSAFCAEHELLARNQNPVSQKLVSWLKSGVDYSMVLRNLGLDPLCSSPSENGVSAWNKTGTDIGVRADVGVMEGKTALVAYAVIANWGSTVSNQSVQEMMGEIGSSIGQFCNQ